MNTLSTFLRSFAAALAVTILLTGCGQDGGSSGQGETQLNMVTVNWIEGLAMTYMQEQIVEDSLGIEAGVKEVQGRGLAFSSVASGDRHFFNEAWLPTTHRENWQKTKGSLQKLGYTYRGTSVGLAVPTYMEVDTITDLRAYRQALDGTINGIEAGASINQQTRQTLKKYGMDDEFSVLAASGPATWQALETAIQEKTPIVVVAWYPHWKWTEFDLKYVDGAHTGHNVDIWGYPEDIFTLVDNGFVERFPKDVVCFLKEFEVNDKQVLSLMSAFRNRGEASKPEAAAQWIENHPDAVSTWMEQTRACVASDTMPQPLPDSAAYSTRRAQKNDGASLHQPGDPLASGQ
ncbi:MAG: glycine betaine ABC transporter substrate-binding protein [Salinibacter sp.]|uniref:glycine betaine ABC transporter substrate-binding protein n=1 Tax=Salinibacter sp. TaxID=2065818 RepID=UPI0035D4D91E